MTTSSPSKPKSCQRGTQDAYFGPAAAEAEEEAAAAEALRGVDAKYGGIYTSATNEAGGTVWTTEGGISQNGAVADMVNSSMYNEGDINILSGVDGSSTGEISANPAFYNSDVARFASLPNVNVYDFTQMTSGEISALLNGPGTTIGAFCNSGICLAPYW